MKKILLLIGVAAAAGAAVYYFRDTSIVQNYILAPVASLTQTAKGLISQISSNPLAIFSIAGGAITAITAFYNHIYKKAVKAKDEVVQQTQEKTKVVADQYQQVITSKDQALTEANNKITLLETTTTKDLYAKVGLLEGQAKTLAASNNELNLALKTMTSPDASEMKRRLEAMGYGIRKLVT